MAETDTTHDHATTTPAVEATAGAHGHADHEGSAHDTAHAQEPLGPIDWRAWGAALLGAIGAAVTAAALYVASHPTT